MVQMNVGERSFQALRGIDLSGSSHTVMTTFPRACPSSRYRMASGTWLSGYVLSMTGVIFPDSWLEPAHILADCLHDPGHVRADDGVVGLAEAVAREAYRVGQTRHDVPDVPTHAGRMHANQYLIVGDLGDVDVPEFQDLGGPVGVPDNCLHRVLLLSPLEWLHLM